MSSDYRLIDVACPECGEVYHLRSDAVGKRMQCHNRLCKHLFLVEPPEALVAEPVVDLAPESDSEGGIVRAYTAPPEEALDDSAAGRPRHPDRRADAAVGTASAAGIAAESVARRRGSRQRCRRPTLSRKRQTPHRRLRKLALGRRTLRRQRLRLGPRRRQKQTSLT